MLAFIPPQRYRWRAVNLVGRAHCGVGEPPTTRYPHLARERRQRGAGRQCGNGRDPPSSSHVSSASLRPRRLRSRCRYRAKSITVTTANVYRASLSRVRIVVIPSVLNMQRSAGDRDRESAPWEGWSSFPTCSIPCGRSVASVMPDIADFVRTLLPLQIQSSIGNGGRLSSLNLKIGRCTL